MKEFLDATAIANTVMLLFQSADYSGKVVLVVEGPTDVKLLSMLLDSQNVAFLPAGGKSKAIAALGIIKVASGRDSSLGFLVNRVFSICDADFDHITKKDYGFGALFLTDTHDVETMMVSSPASKILAAEWGKDDEGRLFLKSNLIQRVAAVASTLGLLRYVNCIHDLQLNFRGLVYEKFLSLDSQHYELHLDLQEVFSQVLLHSPDRPLHVTAEFLSEQMHVLRSAKDDLWNICCGHDIEEFVAFFLRRYPRSSGHNVNQEKVGGALRMAYSKEYFYETRLYKALLGWESSGSINIFTV